VEKEYFGYIHAELEVASWDVRLALPEVKAVAWHHQAKPETEPPPTARGLVYQARCMERATVIEIVLKPAIKGVDVWEDDWISRIAVQTLSLEVCLIR
jgi:hypothetical protein